MTTAALDLRHGTQRVFAHLLVSTLTVSVVNFTVWFAVTFWVYIETRSIMATGLIAGVFLAATSLTGIWFGSIVDRFEKRSVMQGSAVVSLAIYVGCLVVYLTTPANSASIMWFNSFTAAALSNVSSDIFAPFACLKSQRETTEAAVHLLKLRHIQRRNRITQLL